MYYMEGSLVGIILTKLVDGTQTWWKDGELHRTDGPAIESSNGHCEWWKDGKLHRLDGPAIERRNGSVEWYVDHKHIRFPYEFQKVTGMSDEEIFVLILKYKK